MPLANAHRPVTRKPSGSGWAVPDVTNVPANSGHSACSPRISAMPSSGSRDAGHAAEGLIVQPFGDYSSASPATALAFRRYQVEFWPVGNVFETGHRIRVTIVGASAASRPTLPAINTNRVGGPDGAELLVPALPGSNLPGALPR
jgi:hypothetical protein